MATRKLKTKLGEDRSGLQVLKPDLTLPKGYLSKSAIECYQRCAKQYEFRYIHGKKSPPGVALVEGSSHGEALNQNNLHFIKTKKNQQVKTVIERFKDEFSDRSKEIPKHEWAASGENVTDVFRRGETLLQRYMTQHAPKIKPVGVEERVEVMMGGVPVLGFIDLLEKDAIWDYKVVGKAFSQKDADADLQLSIYTKAKKIHKGGFVCLTKSSDSKIVVTKTERTAGDFRAADAAVASVADAIRKGAFPMCNPKEWCCSRRFCGFWSECRGKYLKG